MTTFPPAPSWYLPQILRASSNGRVTYGSRNTLVVVTPAASEQKETDLANENEINSDTDNWRSGSESSEQPSSMVVPHPSASMLTIGSEKSKVTCVAWSPDGQQVAAGLEDGSVELVNVQGKDETTELTWIQHNTTHKEASKMKPRVNAICWNAIKTEQVITCDESGNIVTWDVKHNMTRALTNLLRNPIFLVEQQPHKADVFAFGCKLGFVFIADISNGGKVLHKIRAHAEDIQGLSWSPSTVRDVFVDADEVNDNPESVSLLAVSSRDKTLSVWSSKTGRQVAQMNLLKGQQDRSRSKTDPMKPSWTVCYWIKSKSILTSGLNGELLEWNLEKVKRKSHAKVFIMEESRVVHKEHARTLFCISHNGSVIYTCGQDRSLVAFDMGSNALRFNLPTFASGVYAIAANAIDPSIIAIGAGDGNIRVWKMQSSKATFDTTLIWNKLSATKVTALAWHPDKENILALATDDGRVGTVDALSQRSSPIFYDLKHRSTVYVVCWGPAADIDKQGKISDFSSSKKVLYSCADNAVFMHSELQKSINLETIINDSTGSPSKERKTPKRTDVAFENHSYRFIALGCDDGAVEIFSMPNLEPVCILKSFHKLIQSIAWHPFYIGGSSQASEFHSYIAVASNEFDIHVWNLDTSLVGKSGDNGVQAEVAAPEAGSSNTRVPVLTTPKSILKGHQSRVIYLTWSPLENGKLLSVSYDNTAQVWDVMKEEPLANFSGHSGRLFSGLWNPTNADMIFTGAEDATVFGWKVSVQKNKLPPAKSKSTHAVKKAKEATVDANLIDDLLDERRRELVQTPPAIKSGRKSPKQKKNKLIKVSDDEDSSSSGVEVAVMDKRDVKSSVVKHRQKKKLLFSISSRHEKVAFSTDSISAESTKALIDHHESGAKVASNRFPDLAFITDKEFLDGRLDEEVTALLAQDQTEMAGYLQTFTGDYGKAVRHAMKTSKLTDWHIGLAQAASHDLYLEACDAYAQQLVKEDDILKASTYLLMVGNVLEAIDLLLKHEFHHAAVTVAKSRLPDESDVIKNVYRSWANDSVQHGQFAHAARYFIAASDFARAATMLSKLPDPDSTRLAALLSLKVGNVEDARILAIQCGSKCLENHHWKCLDKLANAVDFEEVKKIHERSQEVRATHKTQAMMETAVNED